MSTTKIVWRNFASLTIAEAATRLCAVLLFVYVARVLGVTALGELAFATAVIGLFTFFADFGLTTLGIREIARNKTDTDSYGTNILLFQLLFTIFLIVFLGLLLLVMPISQSLKAITFCYSLGLIPLALDMSYIFQAHETMEYVMVGKVINQAAYFILGLILVTLFKNVVFVPIAALFSGVAGAFVTYAMLKRRLNLMLKRPDAKTFKLLIVAALPFVISEVLITIYRNIDTVMLQFVKGTNEVGYYSSGYKVVNSIILIISFVSFSFFPIIASSFKNDQARCKQYTLLLAQTIGLASIPLAVGGIVYARQILILVYGSQMLGGEHAFRLLLPLIIIVPLKGLFASIIIAADRQDRYMISGAIGAVVNVVLNVILIPKYGMVGAGAAIVVTETAAGTYLFYSCFRRLDYVGELLTKHALKPTIAMIAMCFVSLQLPNVLVGMPTSGLVYVVVLYVVKGVPESLVVGPSGIVNAVRDRRRRQKGSAVG